MISKLNLLVCRLTIESKDQLPEKCSRGEIPLRADLGARTHRWTTRSPACWDLARRRCSPRSTLWDCAFAWRCRRRGRSIAHGNSRAWTSRRCSRKSVPLESFACWSLAAWSPHGRFSAVNWPGLCARMFSKDAYGSFDSQVRRIRILGAHNRHDIDGPRTAGALSLSPDRDSALIIETLDGGSRTNEPVGLVCSAPHLLS